VAAFCGLDCWMDWKESGEQADRTGVNSRMRIRREM
jgi:hypothetical protein